MADHYDVLIVGGGMVGASLACALGNSGLRLGVIETREPKPFDPSVHDLRVSAVTRASQRIFEVLQAWQGMVERRACPFRRMLVWDGEGRGETRFDCADIAEPTLGHIVENSVIQLALYERLRQFNNVEWFCPAALDQLDLSRAKLVLEDGRALRYRLIVGADGARSKVRELAGIECDSLEYKQHALIANIKTRLPQQDITWQCHARTGPQAFLPLTENRASIVWYHSPEQVQRLLALSEDEFADELGRAFPSRLGGIESIDGRGSFPLCRRHARRYVLPGLALIGDAAHIIHPHIGQGVNLGLLDAAALAEVMLGAQVASRNPASLPVLRRYERWRRGYNLAFMGFSEIVYHAFAQQHLPLRMVRSGLFTIADQIGPINRLCMRYAMGLLGDLPRLAQGKPPVEHAARRLSSNVVYSRGQPR